MAATGPGSSPGTRLGSAAKLLTAAAVAEETVESGVHTKDTVRGATPIAERAELRDSTPDDARTNDAPDGGTLGGMLVGRAAFVGVRGEAPVIEAARALATYRLRAVAVIDGSSVVGVVTERAIVRRVVAAGRDPFQVRCDEIMSGDVVIAYASDTLERGLRLLRESGRKHLIVIEGEDAAECKVLGLLSALELVERTFLSSMPALPRITTPIPSI